MISRLAPILLVILMIPVCLAGQQDPLRYFFDGHYGQVEVGGIYAGAEFHESRPLPARISFYYPVANSIDLSTDYWKRGDSRPMALGIKIGDGPKRWLGRNGWSYALSPHRVRFESEEEGLLCSLRYEFCLNEPAMVVTLTFTNRSGHPLPLEVYTHLKTTLRTCQTYARKDSAWCSFDSSANAVVESFDDSDAARATMFVMNAGARPVGRWTSAPGLAITDSGTSDWISPRFPPPPAADPARRTVPAAAFIYRETVAQRDSLVIVQIVGSCNRSELRDRLSRIATGWRDEVGGYDRFVVQKARGDARFVTGDEWLDRSAVWARGLLASNRHYLDGEVVPMPCPAEYNFYFTHDLLLTNLGAVNFDLGRVRQNLSYVAAHSKDRIIPHAYYWRDNGYKTEYCDPENWNHLWFIIVTARYLRHSGDDSLGNLLYPLVTKSLTEVLSQRSTENLMHAYRPDWWDIGHREGPRSYLTILTVRALRDYLYISTALGRRSESLLEYELLADAMQKSMNDRLWDDSLKYLINYNEGRKDSHYYMGSLLGAVYGELNPSRSRSLVETADANLLRFPVGIMNVAPPDFNTDSARSFFRFAGNEAGDPYLYANGGVWPHANAWYALALNSIGRADSALKFLKAAMTLDGVARSPQGVPAMYEYRFSDLSSAKFGMIDKPSFMWAAGFYLNVLYDLCGFRDNEWNLSFAGELPLMLDSVACTYAFGASHEVTLTGKADRLRSFLSGGRNVPSLVLPLESASGGGFAAMYGTPKTPYLESVNAILQKIEYLEASKTMKLVLSSFKLHRITARLTSPFLLKKMLVDGKARTSYKRSISPDGLIEYRLSLVGTDTPQSIELRFQGQ
jgi:glycogen debranching enzyme